MKLRLLFLLAFAAFFGTANSQSLVLQKRVGRDWSSEQVTLVNKPEGVFYRCRRDIKNRNLPRVEPVKNLELFISEPIDLGWLALYRLPMGHPDYDFVVVLYDHDRQPILTLNLCDLVDNRYCEVQDVRWDNQTHRLLFNMACPSYASEINGKGSKLYCYDYEKNVVLWQTPYLTSNGIFIFDDDYVYCSYGFTNEKDYLFLLDKNTGKIYSKVPTAKAIEYLEFKPNRDGQKLLYAVDYNEDLYIYNVKEPQLKCFTVVYATSSDGFLNVRSQPSMKGKIIGRLEQMFHGRGNGVLIEYGPVWSRVNVDEVDGYVYTKQMGQQKWYTGKGKQVLVARDYILIYAEDFSDSGSKPIFCSVDPGTIIADKFAEEGDYYVLQTAHDNLYVKKSDVIVKNK